MSQSIRIGIQIDSIDPYWVEARETIWQICRPSHRTSLLHLHERDRGPTSQPNVSIELVDIGFRTGHQIESAAAGLEEILALELDALIIAAEKKSYLTQLLDQGLPVIALIDRDVRHPLFTCPVSLEQSARIACDYLAQNLNGRGRVLLCGGRRSQNPKEVSSRIVAADVVFARFPEIECCHVSTPWDYEGAYLALEQDLIGLQAPFDGVFGLSDTLALAAYDYGVTQGLLHDESLIVGINGDPLAMTAVWNGVMTATVATSANIVARKAVDLACRAASGKPLPPTFDYEPLLVTRENVAEVAMSRLNAIADIPSRLVGANRQQTTQRMIAMETGLAINRKLGSILDREALPLELADLIRHNYCYDEVQVFLWSEADQALYLDSPGTLTAERPSLALAEAGILGHAFLANQPVFVPDVKQSRRFAPDPGWPATRTRVATPIRFGSKTVGVLDLHSHSFRSHSPIELEALQSLADQVGVAIRNAELYAEAVEAYQRAEQANHLKSRLVANVTHALRAPLNVILGYSHSALSSPNPYAIDLPHELVKDLRHIQHSGEHLLRLFNDLLDLSQAEIGALEIYPETVDPHALLTETFEGAVGAMDANRTLDWRLELPKTLPLISADPVRLRQIVLNLLSNASKFTDDGHVTLGAIAEEGRLHIWIEDTGRGIEPEDQKRIFEMFAAAEYAEAGDDRTRIGIGLGLSVSNHLARLHDGSIQVESRPGVGTICRIYLPIGPMAKDEIEHEPLVRDLTAEQVPLEQALNSVLRNSGEVVRKIAAQMVAQYTEDLSRDAIAEAAGVSADYMTRLFRQDTGLTPWQFLRRYRVAQAQKLLLGTDLSITQIAKAVGFNDSAYFSRVFSQEAGKSPQQYRKSANSF